jgi:hypothetical protein
LTDVLNLVQKYCTSYMAQNLSQDGTFDAGK